MSIESIHKGKQPHRPHYIPEWAKRRGLKQKDIIREIGADKGTVSRWFKKGATPTREWQEKLGALFGCGREGIFRHPDDDWITQFFRNRSLAEIEKARKILEEIFGPAEKKKSRTKKVA